MSVHIHARRTGTEECDSNFTEVCSPGTRTLNEEKKLQDNRKRRSSRQFFSQISIFLVGLRALSATADKTRFHVQADYTFRTGPAIFFIVSPYSRALKPLLDNHSKLLEPPGWYA